jgi:hypothetical protein
MFLLRITYELWEENRVGLSIDEPEQIIGRLVKIMFGTNAESIDNFLEKTQNLFVLPRLHTVRVVDGWNIIAYHVFDTESDLKVYEAASNKITDENAELLGYKIVSESFKSQITHEELESLAIKQILSANPYGSEPISELRAAREAAKKS